MYATSVHLSTAGKRTYVKYIYDGTAFVSYGRGNHNAERKKLNISFKNTTHFLLHASVRNRI